MANREDDTQAQTGQGAGQTSGSGGGPQPSKSEAQDDTSRVGLKVDIRNADTKPETGSGDSETQDKRRDGT